MNTYTSASYTPTIDANIAEKKDKLAKFDAKDTKRIAIDIILSLIVVTVVVIGMAV